MNNEELNKIMMKADMNLEMLKDRCHDLYEENERLKKELKILVQDDERQQEIIIEQRKK